MTSTDVDVVQPSARAVSVAEEYYLQGRAISPDAIADNIARRILDADSEDDVFGGIEATMSEGLASVEDMLYLPLIFMDVDYSQSSKYEGQGAFGIYMIAKAKPVGMTMAQAIKNNAACEWVADGEPFVASCGAANVMAAMHKAKQAGWLPKAVQIVMAEKETAAGYRPFWPRAIDAKHPLTPMPAKLAKRDRNEPSVDGEGQPF